MAEIEKQQKSDTALREEKFWILGANKIFEKLWMQQKGKKNLFFTMVRLRKLQTSFTHAGGLFSFKDIIPRYKNYVRLSCAFAKAAGKHSWFAGGIADRKEAWFKSKSDMKLRHRGLLINYAEKAFGNISDCGKILLRE